MGVTYLLDTHVLLWLWGDPGRIAPGVRKALGDPKNHLLVSAASAMEVSTKTRRGKLELGHALASTWAARVAEIAAEELQITSAHALLAGSMRWSHRDPFDRLLVAQALTEGVPLVSVDPAMVGVPALQVLDPRS